MRASSVCRLATRKSPLAIRQADIVAALIKKRMKIDVELIPMSTTGDQKVDWSLQDQGGKGLFTKELEHALLEDQADLAVHSAKDMPTDMPDGLTLAAFLEREDARDLLVLRENIQVPASMASGSPRRVAQLKNRFPEIKWMELRGNVETRLRKISQDHQADGTVIAAAGLNRLGISEFPGLTFELLAPSEMVPAPGQGAIAVQTRISDKDNFAILGHSETEKAVIFERKLLESLGGGCQVALGVYLNHNFLNFFHEKTGVLQFNLNESSEDELVEFLKRRIK